MTSGVTDIQVRSGYNASNVFSTFMIALKSDGTVWGTGNNAAGQLGNGNTTSQNTWVQASSISSQNITKIYSSGAYGNGSYAGGDVYAITWTW
jgi:alpha-tubulin suppressor-like RCC1 family protein